MTALNPVSGYDKGVAATKQACKDKRPIIDAALATNGLTRAEPQKLLDPLSLTGGGMREE